MKPRSPPIRFCSATFSGFHRSSWGLKYMKFSIPFAVCSLLFVVAFLFWVTIGYPQINAPSQLYPFNGVILVHVANSIEWAIFENEITKYLLAASYVSVF